jgi:hypothetical protein
VFSGDARAVVGDHQHRGVVLGSDGDGAGGAGVALGVVDQVGQQPARQQSVPGDEHPRPQVGVDRDPAGLAALQLGAGQFGQIDAFELWRPGGPW